MPGYGFSGKPTTTGWDRVRVARAWSILMKRLGYSRYVAQGGDWGAFVTEQMGVLAPPKLLEIHINLASAVPDEVLKALQTGTPPAGLSAEEKYAFDRLAFLFTHGLSPFQQMANDPLTMYSIADSPVGLATWFLDHDLRSYELITRSFNGQREGLTRDDVFDNLTLTWLTNTAISSARLYREHKLPFFVPMGVGIPVAVSAFPDEVYQVPRSSAGSRIPNSCTTTNCPRVDTSQLGKAGGPDRGAAGGLQVAEVADLGAADGVLGTRHPPPYVLAGVLR